MALKHIPKEYHDSISMYFGNHSLLDVNTKNIYEYWRIVRLPKENTRWELAIIAKNDQGDEVVVTKENESRFILGELAIASKDRINIFDVVVATESVNGYAKVPPRLKGCIKTGLTDMCVVSKSNIYLDQPATQMEDLLITYFKNAEESDSED